MELNGLVQCPYDKNHRVKLSRFHQHLLLCKNSHPELDKLLETCAFNALHKYLPEDREAHLTACLDRRRIMMQREIRAEAATTSTNEIHSNQNDRNINNSSNNTKGRSSFKSSSSRAVSRAAPINDGGYDDDDWDEEPCGALTNLKTSSSSSVSSKNNNNDKNRYNKNNNNNFNESNRASNSLKESPHPHQFTNKAQKNVHESAVEDDSNWSPRKKFVDLDEEPEEKQKQQVEKEADIIEPPKQGKRAMPSPPSPLKSLSPQLQSKLSAAPLASSSTKNLTFGRGRLIKKSKASN